jgi:mono/diheme cytochrome c family protein
MRFSSAIGFLGVALSSAWLAGPVSAAGQTPRNVSLPPPLPPTPAAFTPRRSTNALPTDAVRRAPPPLTNPYASVNVTATPPLPAASAATPASSQPPRYVGGYFDPTYIPGLVPINPVGPSPPLAPYPAPRPYVPPTQENVFAYDALVKELTMKGGETNAVFTFALTNTSAAEVTINSVRASCACTVARVPTLPWKLAAGASGSFDVVVDLRGKMGILTKTVTIDSSAGYRYLTVRASVPPPPPTSPLMAAADRARNLQAALADRQAVFRGDCVVCHSAQAAGKRGEPLFQATCAICHDAEHRASMVPNLHALNKPTDAEYWRTWITKGKVNGLMPAWAASEGGVLSPDQIESLVEYLTGSFKHSPVAKLPSPAASTGVQVE